MAAADRTHDHAAPDRPAGPDHDGHRHEGHGHDGGGGWRRFVPLVGHRHTHGPIVDRGLESSDRGIRALKVSLLGLGVTALAQGVVAVLSGSVALLNDTLHNAADALTALPLWLAFSLGRRPASRRLTYGWGRAEDVAGLVVVLAILASAGLAVYEALDALVDPGRVRALPAVAVAGAAGFLGNEAVARYRIRVGREIGSESLVADGLHARTDGFTSLGVLAGAGGVAAGWDAADAWAGLAIAVLILLVLKDAAVGVFGRLVDAVDPDVVEGAERVVAAVPGVDAVREVRMRWVGHRLRAEVRIAVDAGRTVADAHDVAEDVEHALLHDLAHLAAAIVHVDPHGADGDPHATTAHHREERD